MTKHILIELAIVGTLSALVGCGSSSTTGETTTTPAAGGGGEHCGMEGMAEMCPMQVTGTTVAAADTEAGVALAFTTTTGDVEDLRRRVHHMAEMHNEHHAGGMTGEGMQMPAATATAEDVEGGARLLLVPTDATQLDALRAHAHTHAEQMNRGECPMMAHGAHAAGGGHECHHAHAH